MRQNVKSIGLLKALCVFVLSFVMLGFSLAAEQKPTMQDLQIVGRVLSFQESPASGVVVVAIVYNPSEPSSLREARETSELIGNGLSVGNIVLKSVIVNQMQLAETAGFNAIISTADVDQSLLMPALKLHHVPCLTRHLGQVEQGICVVAICVNPSVSIVVNQANATLAGVHFATAFRMMVREI